MTKFRKSMLFASVSALTLIVGAPALAQNGNPAAKSAAGVQSDTLETVVVTATKRSEDVQKVALTVDAIGSQQIQDLKLFNFKDIQTTVPGLEMDQADGRSQAVSLRGISFNPDSGAQAAVDIYWNETPISAGDAFKTMFDVGDVEVIRGPQGTLRGRSSPAGAILMTSHKPDLNNFGGFVNQSLSDRGLLNTEAAVNYPIIPGKLALRVAALYHQDREDGITNIVLHDKDRAQTSAFRATLEWVPTDNIDFTLVHQEMRARSIEYPASAGNPAGVASPYSYGAVYGTIIKPSDRYSLDYGAAAFGNDSKMTTLTGHFDFGGSELTSITGWQELVNSFDRSLQLQGQFVGLVEPQASIGHTRQLTQELRFQSTGERFWDYLFGVYMSDNRTSSHTTGVTVYPGAFGLSSGPIVPVMDPAFVGQMHINGPNYSRDIALFMDHRFHITDSDEIELGVRWLDERQHRGIALTIDSANIDISDRIGGAVPAPNQGTCSYLSGAYFGGLPLVYNPSAPAPGACDGVVPTGTINLSLIPANLLISHAQAWTGAANYVHHFDESMMAYINYGHSYRPATVGFSTAVLAVQPNVLVGKPEKSDSLEIGVKNSFFDHRLQVNLDVYYQKFIGFINEGNLMASADATTGFPVNFSGSPTCASVAACATTTTAGFGNEFLYLPFNGNARTKGAELSVSALIVSGWTAQFNAAYASSKYIGGSLCNDYNGDGTPDVTLSTSLVPGKPAVQPGKNISVCSSGGRISSAPPFQFSVTSEYDVSIASGIMGYVRGLYRPVMGSNRTPYYLTSATGGITHLFAYHMINMYVGVRDADDDRWEVSLWGKNLLNETGGESEISGADAVYTPGGGTGGQAGWPRHSGYYASLVQNPREFGMTLSYRFGQ